MSADAEPTIWRPLLIAHHRQDQLHRCVLLPLGRRRLALCARCLAFYPAMLLSIFAQALLGAQALGSWDWLLVLGGEAPMLLDWTRVRLRARGSARSSLLTGAIGGAALGRAFLLYFREPGNEIFWANLLLIVLLVLTVEVVRQLGLNRL